jgi:hypothetical protein
VAGRAGSRPPGRPQPRRIVSGAAASVRPADGAAAPARPGRRRPGRCSCATRRAATCSSSTPCRRTPARSSRCARRKHTVKIDAAYDIRISRIYFSQSCTPTRRVQRGLPLVAPSRLGAALKTPPHSCPAAPRSRRSSTAWRWRGPPSLRSTASRFTPTTAPRSPPPPRPCGTPSRGGA